MDPPFSSMGRFILYCGYQGPWESQRIAESLTAHCTITVREILRVGELLEK